MTNVSLVATSASLLSGEQDECWTPYDPTCIGGVAAVGAFTRHLAQNESILVLPRLEIATPFAAMHPLGWNINRYVLHDLMGWRAFIYTASILSQNKKDLGVSPRDISDLQTNDIPLLLSNAYVPPTNSWYYYQRPIFFDDETGVAVLSIAGSGDSFNVPQVDSARALLDYIARLNSEAGCTPNDSAYAKFFNLSTSNNSSSRCWIPVIIFADADAIFEDFVNQTMAFENKPALIVENEGNSIESFGTPSKVNGIWLYSYQINSTNYNQIRLLLSEGGKEIDDIELMIADLTMLPDAYKDDTYRSDLEMLRILANESLVNDPVVGKSEAMPTPRLGELRACKAGECAMGNLFADAMQWYTKADVSFTTSGGFRGDGWPTGNVKTSDLWAALPFPNTICTGTFSGLSLFRLLNYSMAVATFSGIDTDEGGRLLQVSGARVVYNTELEGSRLVSVDIWNAQNQTYVPINRLTMYKFATDSYVCLGYPPFPDLLGKDLVIPGEVRGAVGSTLIQDIVAEYLSNLTKPYDTSIQGRLANDTSVRKALNLTASKDDCSNNTYWDSQVFTCIACPPHDGVTFLLKQLDFTGEILWRSLPAQTIDLVNSELYNVTVVSAGSPAWADFSAEIGNVTVDVGVANLLASGARMSLGVSINPSEMGVGTNQGTISFAVSSSGQFLGCPSHTISFEVVAKITPPLNEHQLGPIRTVGWVFTGLVVFGALFCAGWVMRHRRMRIIMTMQPIFLITICVGVVVMGLTIIPLSIDDGISSTRGCDIACVAAPWLLSMGFTVAMSALFSKLWRINRLFQNPGFRRIKVEVKDVLAPFAVLFLLNLTFMLVWTVVDPPRWERHEIDGEDWNTYGKCSLWTGPVSTVMFTMVCIVNASALMLASYQAYKARNISDEFSEAKSLAAVLFSWVQLVIVGIPVLYLIDKSNTTAKFFLEVALIFGCTISMLVCIFVPIFIAALRARIERSRRGFNTSASNSRYRASEIGGTKISGLADSSKEHLASCTEDRIRMSLTVPADKCYLDMNVEHPEDTSSFAQDDGLTDIAEEPAAAILPQGGASPHIQSVKFDLEDDEAPRVLDSRAYSVKCVKNLMKGDTPNDET